jgi:hypothetical protein
VIAIISPANHSLFTTSSIPFTVQVTELYPGPIWYRIDGLGVVSFPTNTSITFTDGDHMIKFFTNDSAGNTATTGQLHVSIDTMDPAITIITPVQNGNYSSQDVMLSFTIIEPNLDTTWYRVNGSSNSTIAGNGTITMPGEGSWHVDLFANDTHSRVGMASVTFNVGLTLPTIHVLTAINNTRVDADFLASVSITSLTGHQSWIELNGVAGAPLYFTGSNVTILLAAMQEGINELVFFANDSFGHVVSDGTYLVEKVTWGRLIGAGVPAVLYYAQWSLTITFTSNSSGILQVVAPALNMAGVSFPSGGVPIIGPVQIVFFPDGTPCTVSAILDFTIPSTPGSFYIARYATANSSFDRLASTTANGHVTVTLDGLSVFCVMHVQPPTDDLAIWILVGSCIGIGVLIPASIGVKKTRRKKAKQKKAYLDSLSKP